MRVGSSSTGTCLHKRKKATALAVTLAYWAPPLPHTSIHSPWLPTSTPSTLAPPTSLANDTSILPVTQTKKTRLHPSCFSLLLWLLTWKRVMLVVRIRASPSHPLTTSSSLLPAMQPHHPSPEPFFPPLLSSSIPLQVLRCLRLSPTHFILPKGFP